MTDAAQAIRSELKATRQIKREAEQKEKRLTRALDALEGPARVERGPRVPMRKRADEVFDYLRRLAQGEKVKLRVVIEHTDVPKTSIYKAVDLLLEDGRIERFGENGHVSIDDLVRVKAEGGGRKQVVVKPGEGVRN